MRRELEGKALRGVRVTGGRAEDLRPASVPDEWADGVVVAQAFHWFATEEALGELGRVLKAGGVLGMIWNIDDCESFCCTGTRTHTTAQSSLIFMTTLC